MTKHFLIVKLSALGDIIQAFPVAEYLREKFPGCHIDWACKEQYRSLIEAHPLIDYTQLRPIRYDAIFDLQGNCRSSLITLNARGTKVGFARKSVPEWPNLLVTNKRYNVALSSQISLQYLSLVQQFFEDTKPFFPRYTPLHVDDEDKAWTDSLNCKGAIMVCPSSRWPNKQPSISYWKALLAKRDEKIILIYGTEAEKKLCYEIDPKALILGNLSFTRWQYLMSQMKLICTVDSAALHLAALAKTPTYALFGPSNPSVYNPIGEYHKALQGTCPYNMQFVKRCPILRTCETGACIKKALIN